MAPQVGRSASMNRTVEILIHGFAFGGRAVGRDPQGKVCFVRGAVPGETVQVSLTADKKNYSEGMLSGVTAVSPARLTPECPNPCPGCSYAHVPYEMELEWKQRQFRFFAEKARLRSDPQVFLREPMGAPARTGWRSKIRLSLDWSQDGGIQAGYRGEDNRTLIPVTDCPLAVPAIREALRSGQWRSLLTGNEKTITFRWTRPDGLRIYTDRGGSASIRDELDGFGIFETGESSFFQINPYMSGKLAVEVLDRVRSAAPALLAELYCGCGCFSILCTEHLPGLHAWGVELDPRAVQCAARNARCHGVADRTGFDVGDSAKVFRKKYPQGLPPDSLLLADPPRTGLDQAALKLIARSGAKWILYVSCSPDTLFRDLQQLEEAGYRITESRLLDLFPSTAHFESITVLAAEK